ncbi:MAG TPA: hypothetical protein DDW21_01155 [Verrucomicrobiales bacterium]|nr:MAG: hypothetical protein B9S37_10215 [Verrucomicrobiae bacterium Tous-C3TDCM]PAZ06175.1 MAG: hypothetical protein CAK88_04505 [Verrucomicrobiae bacterium AMD-G2]HBE22073.1 hypothetical protein [Verrucomicrobiales bacterium]
MIARFFQATGNFFDLAHIHAFPTANLTLDCALMSHDPQPDSRFDEFLFLQAQNAGLFLGQIPHPATGQKTVNLRAAKSVLDCLEMLEAKTVNNLTSNEKKLLQAALENIRTLYQKHQ